MPIGGSGTDHPQQAVAAASHAERGSQTRTRSPGQPKPIASNAVRSVGPAVLVRVGPLLGDQAAVPAQQRGRGDDAVIAQARRKASDQGGEHGSVGPAQTGASAGSAEYRDFVAQDEQLEVLG
jgi:hypothetical protein